MEKSGGVKLAPSTWDWVVVVLKSLRGTFSCSAPAEVTVAGSSQRYVELSKDNVLTNVHLTTVRRRHVGGDIDVVNIQHASVANLEGISGNKCEEYGLGDGVVVADEAEEGLRAKDIENANVHVPRSRYPQ